MVCRGEKAIPAGVAFFHMKGFTMYGRWG